MVEMIVAISIFAIIGSVGLVSFMRNRQSTDLERSSSELASNIRKVQGYAKSGKSTDNPTLGLSVPRAYGLSIDKNVSDEKYRLYADYGGESDDYHYDPADPDPDEPDVLLEEYDLVANTIIDTMDVANLRADFCRADIVFIIPSSKLIVSAAENCGDDPVIYDDLPSAIITLLHEKSADTKDIVVEGGFLGGVTIEE